MKKKLFGLFFVATLALTLSTTTSGATSVDSRYCSYPPPEPGCICMGHDLYICP